MECWIYVCPTEGCAHVALFRAGDAGSLGHDPELEILCPHCLDDVRMINIGQTSMPLTVASI